MSAAIMTNPPIAMRRNESAGFKMSLTALLLAMISGILTDGSNLQSFFQMLTLARQILGKQPACWGHLRARWQASQTRGERIPALNAEALGP